MALLARRGAWSPGAQDGRYLGTRWVKEEALKWMGFQQLLFGSFLRVVGEGSCYSSLAGPLETGGGCWNLHRVRGRATPHHQVSGTMGYCWGNWLRLPQTILLKTVSSLPPPHPWTHCRLVSTPAVPLKIHSLTLLDKPSDLFVLSPCQSDLPAAFVAGDLSFLLVVFFFLLPCVVSLFCVFFHSSTFLSSPWSSSFSSLYHPNIGLSEIPLPPFFPLHSSSLHLHYLLIPQLQVFGFNSHRDLPSLYLQLSLPSTSPAFAMWIPSRDNSLRSSWNIQGEKVCSTWTGDKMTKSGLRPDCEGHAKKASCILDSGLKNRLLGPEKWHNCVFFSGSLSSLVEGGLDWILLVWENRGCRRDTRSGQLGKT